MLRIGTLLLLLTGSLLAQESALKAYKQARSMRGSAKKQFAGDQAERFDGQAPAKDQLYVGKLWAYAEEWSKAADAFGVFLSSGVKSKNRPNALLERSRCLLNAKRYGEVPAVTQAFRQEFPSHKYLGRMRFNEGRALRVNGDLDGALKAFRAGVNASDENSRYEVVDCLAQMGRYDEAGQAAAELDTGSSRFVTFRRALPNLGKPLPRKLAFDRWAGRELLTMEVLEKPTIFSFWSTMGGKSRQLIHDVTNRWAAALKGKVNAIGPAVYLKFDPTTMRMVDDMSKATEQGFMADWHDQYGVRYPLVLMGDNALHELCGVDPEKPALPAFAISDKKGVLRYVRVGSSAWEIEAAGAMLKRVANE